MCSFLTPMMGLRLSGVHELVSYCGKQIGARAIARPPPSEDEWRKVRLDFGALFSQFRNDARNDLGVHPPLHTFEEWRKILRVGTRLPLWTSVILLPR
jgi:hypothetical protein